MATFALIPGAGSTSWYWHRVEPILRAAGHDTLAVDLPCDEDWAGLADYAEVTVAAVGDRREVVLVAQSMAGFHAPLVADRIPIDLIVLVAAMVPAAHESPGDWWTNTGHEAARRQQAARDGVTWEEANEIGYMFLHDLPADVAEESIHHVVEQSGTPFGPPCPLERWPDVPTRFILCRDDRFFPAEFQRRIVRERLGIEPDEMPGGHLPALGHPVDLADRLLAYWEGLAAGS